MNTGTEEDKPQAKRLVRRIVGAFRPYWPVVALVGLLILVTAGIGVVNPLLIRVVFDSALFPASGGPDLDLLWVLAGVMAGITVLGGLLGIWHTYLTNQVGQRVMGDLRERLYRHLQRQPLSFFTDTRTGEIQSRVANDVGGVQTVVTNTVSDTIGNLVIFVSTLVAMAVLSWQLALVSVGMAPAFAFMSRYVGQRRRRVTAEAQESKAEMSAITQETLSVSGITLSKLFGRQDQEIRRFRLESQKLSDLSVRQQITGQFFWAVMQIFFSVSPVVLWGQPRGDHRGNDRGVHHSAEPPLLSHLQSLAGVGRHTVFHGTVRADIRISGHCPKDHQCSAGDGSQARRDSGQGHLRFRADELSGGSGEWFSRDHT